MGNCMETFAHSLYEEEIQQQRDIDQEKQEKKTVAAAEAAAKEEEQQKGTTGFVKEGSLRIKVLLTKEELGWLLFQLKEKGGGNKRLQDVLVEIESGSRGRKEAGHWKPSLDSIMETPEIQTMH